MPLSEEELRLLEQMERALVAEDPKLASTMRGTTLRAAARRRALLAGVVFLLGVVVLMTGAVTRAVAVGVIGFVVMLVAAYVALNSWRGQNRVAEQPRPGQPGTPAGPPTGSPGSFSVLEGGRGKKGRKRGPREPRASRGSMMQRFEERWRRRRDQNGY